MWWTGWAECHQCRYRWVAILEPDTPGYPLECPECEAMDGEMVWYTGLPDANALRQWGAELRDGYLQATAALTDKYGYEIF